MTNIFSRARLKLMGYYLLIIMAISISFSAFIYKSVTGEFQRRLDMIENRLQLTPRGPAPQKPQEPYFIEDYYEARNAVLIVLIYTNGVIFFFSAVAGYFLAGKTLKPIEEAMEEQKRFISDASHELKTPLTSMQTAIEVTLRDKGLKLSDAKIALRENLTDIDQLRKLTENLLSLTRLQQNSNEPVKEKTDLSKIIKKSIKTLSPMAKTKKIKIKLTATPVTILAEPQSLEKLFTILIDNAIKYSNKKGEVKIETNKFRRSVQIAISDNGPGINKKDLPYIFDRFYRADKARTKQAADGFGLGLSIAKKIVDHHNGSIKVKSEPNKLTTFLIKLPL